jgi:hypothetical protein
MPPTVLAQGNLFGCNIVLVAFVAIAFVSWIINQIAAHNKPAPRKPGPRPARPRNDRIQQEIDQFIQEAAGRRPPRRGEVLAADDIEIVDAPARGRRPAPRRAAPPVVRPAVAAQQPRGAPRPGQAAAERRLTGSEQLGAGLSDHVRTHMDNRVGVEVQQHLPHMVDQGVSQHLGAFAALSGGPAAPAAGAPAGRGTAAPALALLAELRSPAGVRQAIVMQEILQRPLALRRRRQ